MTIINKILLEPSNKKEENNLSTEERRTLLQIARQSIAGFLKNKKVPEFKVTFPRLTQPQGVFVTLRKNGELRGCIGRIIEEKTPLYQLVSQMAIAAAVEDHRFQPTDLAEIKDIDIEISVLSPLKKIKNPLKEIEVGKHGVVIQQGSRSGVFLPQVATENNWNLEEYMGQLCIQKAGLDWDEWKNGRVNIYVFTAKIFTEKNS